MTSPLITEPQPPTIAYAALHDDDASLARSLRRLIGWFALIYGGSSAIAYMYFIALSRNWLPTRVNFGDFASLQTILDLTWVLALALVAVAGVWLLRLGHTAVILVRMTATMALLAMLMRQTYETIWGYDDIYFRASSLLYLIPNATPLAALLLSTFGRLGRALRRE